MSLSILVLGYFIFKSKWPKTDRHVIRVQLQWSCVMEKFNQRTHKGVLENRDTDFQEASLNQIACKAFIYNLSVENSNQRCASLTKRVTAVIWRRVCASIGRPTDSMVIVEV